MNKNQLWAAYLVKYPKWSIEDHVVKVTARSMKEMLQHAFEAGVEHNKSSNHTYSSNPLGDIFK